MYRISLDGELIAVRIPNATAKEGTLTDREKRGLNILTGNPEADPSDALSKMASSVSYNPVKEAEFVKLAKNLFALKESEAIEASQLLLDEDTKVLDKHTLDPFAGVEKKEDYLKLGRENCAVSGGTCMVTDNEEEALKAQAIAARSYAVATKNAGKHASKGFDLVATTADQAYGGASVEKERTSKAVDDTTGIVLVQSNKVIPTYYHASSGGQTKVWSSGSSFLQSVPSFDGDRKKNGHGVGMSQHGAKYLADQGYNAYQILNYFYKKKKSPGYLL